MTPFQHEPSAHAPWTRTMFGWTVMSVTPRSGRADVVVDDVYAVELQ
jgi:hypothetical protein